MKNWLVVSLTLLSSCVLTALIYGLTLLPAGLRELGPLENISGIPYPATSTSVRILERLAHADIHLKQPVLGQVAHITVTFIPHTTRKLAVGIRENNFWLSYSPQNFYTSTRGSEERAITKTITIPVSDKFQDTDQSLDMMFFATSDGQSTNFPSDSLTDTTDWDIQSLSVSISHALPSRGELVEYIRSILKKERAL